MLGKARYNVVSLFVQQQRPLRVRLRSRRQHTISCNDVPLDCSIHREGWPLRHAGQTNASANPLHQPTGPTTPRARQRPCGA